LAVEVYKKRVIAYVPPGARTKWHTLIDNLKVRLGSNEPELKKWLSKF
jgi:hypothetical protein